MAVSYVNLLLHFVCLACFCCAFGWTGCPPEFEDMCKCGFVPYGPSKKLTYVTNCTNAGFDNAMMLRKLPQETEVLVFVGNEVRDLPLNIIGQDIVYEKLHTIDLSNNHIQTIKGRTFHNVANVTTLILNDNDLYIVSKDHHPRMFSNFVNLKELHLRNAFTEKVKAGDYLNNLAEIFENSSLNHLRVLNMEHNEISSLHQGEFCSLPVLEELYLGGNHLKDIPLNFSCLRHLKVLDVGNNFIPYLSDETLQNLEVNRIFKINLTGNPFICDCNMVNTYKWMKTTLITLISKGYLYCYAGFPPIIGRPLIAVDIEDLQCFTERGKSKYHSPAALISLIVGLIFLTIVMSGLIYKNRLALGNYMHRAFRPIRSKFHYVSLDRRDATMSV